MRGLFFPGISMSILHVIPLVYYLRGWHRIGETGTAGRMKPDATPQTNGDLIMIKTGAALVTAMLATIVSAPVAAADVAGVFSQGRTHFSVVGGSGSAFNDSYFVLGVGVSYYLVDGLNVGLSAESWTGGDPGITKLTPSVQYVFYQVPNVSPYVGAFYRRTYIDNLPDLDSVGGRAGVYVAAGRNAFVGFGAVYESYLDCDTTLYKDCSDTYPEISFTFAF